MPCIDEPEPLVHQADNHRKSFAGCASSCVPVATAEAAATAATIVGAEVVRAESSTVETTAPAGEE
jgi:hypothetical protein